MKLRRQLILVSLLTLSLPWAGCQYIREMESALREGQSRALLATADAVANRIADEPLLLAELTQHFANQAADAQLYAHPLSAPPLLDGYDDEWRDREFAGKAWHSDDLQLRVRTGHHDKQVYLLVEVKDKALSYYHPGKPHFSHSDHLVLRTLDRDGRLRDFVLVASAPGAISAFDVRVPHHEWLLRAYREDPLLDASDLASAPRRQEHAINGVWQEKKEGYQVELQIPWYLTQGYLGIAVVNASLQSPQWLGSITPSGPPAPLVRHSESLGATLKVFAGEDLRLRLATNNQWLIAEAGQLQTSTALADEQGWLMSLVRLLFIRQHFPPEDHPERDGRLDTEEIAQALAGNRSTQWYRHGKLTLARAAAPIYIKHNVLGAIVAEQTTAGMLALTHTAFRRLVFYTLLATGLSGLGLIAYASWLSLRVRRLSRAADTAIRDDGNLEQNFVASAARDEIGDLSRSYNQLLTRVQEYTEYLRTLSNKLSHELRTPLAVVRSSLDNLDNEHLDEQAKIYAARAHEGSQRLSAILNAISSASRVEESIRHAEMRNFALDELLRELAQAYQDIVPQQIQVNIAEQQAYPLYGSPDLIVQMLDKFLDNAADFCPPAGTIAFSLSKQGKVISLVIRNDGPLLPEKMQNQLFDSLVSLRQRQEAPGDEKIHLGLGLHIVRLIAEHHRAQVIARNRADRKGVEFEVIFPASIP